MELPEKRPCKMGSVGLSTVGAGFYTLGKEVISVDDAIIGGNLDRKCYEILKGEMGFPWKEVDEC